MSDACELVHNLANQLKRHRFPFEKSDIPLNGIYFLFQEKEKAHKNDRIVRIGTHTGDNQLRSRLKQHFLLENKDRSIFRKNIGRALLNKRDDPFLKFWDIDLTTRKAKDKYLPIIDIKYQKEIEMQVSSFIQNSFTFAVFEVPTKIMRLELESKLISTLSWCVECKPSKEWLGNWSPKWKIVKNGLWLVNELHKTPFDHQNIESLSRFLKL